MSEPFGYFRCNVNGWEDCAETDEGAIALYEHPHHAEDKIEMVMPDGSVWHPYALSYESDGMTYCFNLMATSMLHASLMLEDLKKTATLDGKVIDVLANT